MMMVCHTPDQGVHRVLEGGWPARDGGGSGGRMAPHEGMGMALLVAAVLASTTHLLCSTKKWPSHAHPYADTTPVRTNLEFLV